jgi:hypothetical protein
MERFTETSPAPTVQISYENFRRCLEQSIEADEFFPWLDQRRYLLDISSVGDDGITLKLSSSVSA